MSLCQTARGMACCTTHLLPAECSCQRARQCACTGRGQRQGQQSGSLLVDSPRHTQHASACSSPTTNAPLRAGHLAGSLGPFLLELCWRPTWSELKCHIELSPVPYVSESLLWGTLWAKRPSPLDQVRVALREGGMGGITRTRIACSMLHKRSFDITQCHRTAGSPRSSHLCSSDLLRQRRCRHCLDLGGSHCYGISLPHQSAAARTLSSTERSPFRLLPPVPRQSSSLLFLLSTPSSLCTELLCL